MTQTEKENKKTIYNFSFKDFSLVCQELEVIEKGVKELLEIADDYNTEPRDKIRIYQWLIEMNIGKPRQISDNYVTTKDKPSQVSFDILENREGVNTKGE